MAAPDWRLAIGFPEAGDTSITCQVMAAITTLGYRPNP
jgi:hypothetical protein